MKDGEIVLKEIFSFKQVGVANDGSVMGALTADTGISISFIKIIVSSLLIVSIELLACNVVSMLFR